MTTTTQTLASWLLDRIAEDEAAARAADEYGDGCPWRWVDPGIGKVKQSLVDARGRTLLPSATGDVYPSWMVAAHIVRHDPARVLADCAAKRQIVEMVERRHRLVAGLWEQSKPYRSESFPDGPTEWADGGAEMAITAAIGQEKRVILALESALRALAQPYADHPGFREEWRS